MEGLFELRSNISEKKAFAISMFGFFFFVGLWQLACSMSGAVTSVFPSPLEVIRSLKPLFYEDALTRNAIYSIKLNFYGYIEAVAISIPLGFVIGLFPFFREMCRKYLDAVRFTPLVAVIGLFIGWFGIEMNMKVQFLAVGIIVYLLPVVVQRIQETEETYVQTLETLSKNRWDIIRKVFIPDVLARVFDDIRVLVAISWTYITVAELVNKDGGLGAIAFLAARQSRTDKVFAIMITIMVIGLLQDKVFKLLDRLLFPHKYATK